MAQIKFNPKHIPRKDVYLFAKKIKQDHPKIWKKGGNIFGNTAFINLEKVIKRGYWKPSERWMYIKWHGYVARHKKDFRLPGVIAMLKWVDIVEKGFPYMKQLVQKEITKQSLKGNKK